MRQIKNNFKFSNDKNYNKEFLDELEKKEEFDCIIRKCLGELGSCTVDGCTWNVGSCLFVGCRKNVNP